MSNIRLGGSMSDDIDIVTVNTKTSVFHHPSRKTIDVSPKSHGKVKHKRPASAERIKNMPFTQRIAERNRPSTANQRK
jgi:hypothetical protein